MAMNHGQIVINLQDNTEIMFNIDVPLDEVGTEVMNEDGDRFLVYKNDKPAGVNNATSDEYLLYTDYVWKTLHKIIVLCKKNRSKI